MQINKLLPRDIEKLSYVQKELYVGFPDESKEILLAIKDIRSSNLEEDEIDLLLEGLEENLKTNPILIEEINKILGFKDKVDEVKDKIHSSDGSINRVIVADEPYAVSEKEIQGLTQQEIPKEEPKQEVSQEPQQEIPKEVKENPQPIIQEEVKEESVQSVKEESQQKVEEEPQQKVKEELSQDINMKIEDLSDSPKEELKQELPKEELKEESQHETKVESQSDSPEKELQSEDKKDVVHNKLLKAMIDFIVKDLTVETYRSFNVNSDEEVVKELLKEEGYDV